MHIHGNTPDDLLLYVLESYLQSTTLRPILVDAIHEAKKHSDTERINQFAPKLKKQSNFWRIQDSRNGPVRRLYEPLVTSLNNPNRRVLFNAARDINPFFHYMECLWIVCGQDDVASIAYFNKRFAEYSDDGETLSGAYGKRLATGDQIAKAVELLKRSKYTRRAVLSLWTPSDLNRESKDIPCNLFINPQIIGDYLDMTVHNRSNDILWGMLGANICHFSFLHEYLYALLLPTYPTLRLGRLHQLTANAHIYTDVYSDEKILDILVEAYAQPKTPYEMQRKDAWLHPSMAKMLAFEDTGNQPLFMWDSEEILQVASHNYRAPILRLLPVLPDAIELKRFDHSDLGHPMTATITCPLMQSWMHYKNKDYENAIKAAEQIMQDDWRTVCVNWLRRRHTRYLKNNPYAPESP